MSPEKVREMLLESREIMTGDFKAGTYEVCCECGLFLQVDKIEQHTSQPCPTEYELLKERMRLDIIEELDRIKTNYFDGSSSFGVTGYEAEDIVRAEREILSEEFGFTNFLEGKNNE